MSLFANAGSPKGGGSAFYAVSLNETLPLLSPFAIDK